MKPPPKRFIKCGRVDRIKSACITPARSTFTTGALSARGFVGPSDYAVTPYVNPVQRRAARAGILFHARIWVTRDSALHKLSHYGTKAQIEFLLLVVLQNLRPC